MAVQEWTESAKEEEKAEEEEVDPRGLKKESEEKKLGICYKNNEIKG